MPTARHAWQIAIPSSTYFLFRILSLLARSDNYLFATNINSSNREFLQGMDVRAASTRGHGIFSTTVNTNLVSRLKRSRAKRRAKDPGKNRVPTNRGRLVHVLPFPLVNRYTLNHDPPNTQYLTPNTQSSNWQSKIGNHFTRLKSCAIPFFVQTNSSLPFQTTGPVCATLICAFK